MSTRAKNRKNNQQESTEHVSETIVSPLLSGPLSDFGQNEVMVTGGPRIENSVLENLSASLEEELTFQIKKESQKEQLKCWNVNQKEMKTTKTK